jgi:hypothetical protein
MKKKLNLETAREIEIYNLGYREGFVAMKKAALGVLSRKP